MFTSQKLNSIVGSDGLAWTQAGEHCLPRCWRVLSLPDSRYTSNSLEMRLLLKYALIHERQCLSALISADFSPFCLRSSGLQLDALSRALPSARYTVNDFNQLQDPSATHSRGRRAGLKRSQSIPADDYRHTEENEASVIAEANEHLHAPSPPASVEVAIENPLEHNSSEEVENVAEEEVNEIPSGGESVQVDLPDVVLADTPNSLKKHHNPLQRSITKLFHVATGKSKARKPRSNSEGTPVASSLPMLHPSKKRVYKFEESGYGQDVNPGVDEAWFKLPNPANFRLPNSASTHWRMMSETNLLASVLSVYGNNERLICTGAYVIRKLCYMESPALLDEPTSIRCRLANTTVVSVLLDALRQFKKDHHTVAAILVALGNLAISSVLASQIGDRGLSLIVAAITLHRSKPKVVEFGAFLLLNVCDGRIEYKRKLRSLGMPQLIVKILDKFVSSLKPNRHHPSVIASDIMSSSSSSSIEASPSKSVKNLRTSEGSSPNKKVQPIAHATIPRLNASTPSKVNVSSIQRTWRDRLAAVVQPTIDLQESMTDSQLPSESDDVPDSPRSREHGGGSGGSSEADFLTDESDDETAEAESEVAAEVRPRDDENYGNNGEAEEELDEKACKWMLKRRPLFAQLQGDFGHLRRSEELVMMRRLLDLLSVLSSGYDMIKPELAQKAISLLGELTVALFGCPWPHIDSLLNSAFRALVVIYEWDVQSHDWRHNSILARSLCILSKAFLRAEVPLKYDYSCFLIIFSIIWKRPDQNWLRKRLVNLIVSMFRMEANNLDLSNSSYEFGLRSQSSSSVGPQEEAKGSKRSVSIFHAAAMLGDMAHSFYEIRMYICETGVLKILKVLSEDENMFKLEDRNRIGDILDEFEDNPLLRGRHRQRQAMMQQMQQLQQQQQQDDAPIAPAPNPVNLGNNMHAINIPNAMVDVNA